MVTSVYTTVDSTLLIVYIRGYINKKIVYIRGCNMTLKQIILDLAKNKKKNSDIIYSRGNKKRIYETIHCQKSPGTYTRWEVGSI